MTKKSLTIPTSLSPPAQTFLDTMLMPTTFAPLQKRAPIRLQQGLLLVGPSGCGKTYLVHAAASKLRGIVRFLQVKGPELLSKYIGQSEAGVRGIFEQAQQCRPSCIFFDEIEALCPRRGADSTGVTDRVVNQMLTYLDGVEARESLFVIAATARPDLVDPALLRPGRLDKILYCGAPGGEVEEWRAVLRAVSRKFVLSAEADEFRDKQLPEKLAALAGAETGGRWTSADARAILSNAQLVAIHRAIEEERSSTDGRREDDAVVITQTDLETAFAETKPSMSVKDAAHFEKLHKAYRDRGGPSGNEIIGEKQKVALA